MIALMGPTWPSQTDSCFPSSENRSILPSLLAVKMLPPKPGRKRTELWFCLLNIPVGKYDWKAQSCCPPFEWFWLLHRLVSNSLNTSNTSIPSPQREHGPPWSHEMPRSVRCQGRWVQHRLDTETPRFPRARPLRRHPNPKWGVAGHRDTPQHPPQQIHDSNLAGIKTQLTTASVRISHELTNGSLLINDKLFIRF